MQKKCQIKGQLMIEVPKNFRKRQLSRHKQLKDKEIRRQLELLECRRKEDIFLQKQWKKQKQELQKFAQYHQQRDAILREKQRLLKQEVFKLQIRKEQIQSKTNPDITKQRGLQLMKYLKCAPYIIGKRVQKIVFWGGEKRFFRLKFLLDYAIDLRFKKSVIRRHITQGLSQIVYVKKLTFEGQTAMLVVKEIKGVPPLKNFSNGYSTGYKTMLAPYKVSSQPQFQLMVYAVTGKYFCLKKQYTYQDLQYWVSFFCKKAQPIQKHRLSVADAIAKQNALKELTSREKCSQHSQEESSSNQINDASVGTFQKQSAITMLNHKGSSSVNEAFPWSLPVQGCKTTNNYALNVSQHSCLSDETNNFSQSLTEEIIQISQEDIANQSVVTATRKTLRSRSSFHQQQDHFKKTEKNLNKSFLEGKEQILFPKELPIKNLVMLKKRGQIYILSQYVRIKEKKEILDKSIFRFKFRIMLKKQLRKCLFYKVITVSNFCEPYLGVEPQMISLPVLFMVKQHEGKEGPEQHLTCCAIKRHQNMQKVFDFITLLYKEVLKQKVDIKQDRSRRVSHMKNSGKPNSGRRSKDLKRMSASKHSKLDTKQYHEKSGFAKQSDFNNKAKNTVVSERFSEFIKDKYICYSKKSTRYTDDDKKIQYFYTSLQLNNAIRAVITLQINFRRRRQQAIYKKYRQTSSKIVLKIKYFKESKVFVSCLSYNQTEMLKVWIYSLELGRSQQAGCFQYAKDYQSTVLAAIEALEQTGNLLTSKIALQQKIDKAIHIQLQLREKLERQRPQKHKRTIKRFLYMIFLRYKARKNIFHVQKLIIKDRLFFFIIRRDSKVRSILQCSLYDFPGVVSKGMNINLSKEAGSQMGWHKQISHCSSRDYNSKSYIYQHIYLQENYFKGIDKKSIIDEFCIDYKVFLLKPQKNQTVYYIERLNSIDINSDELSKEIIMIEKDIKNALKNNSMYSTKSIKNIISNQSFLKLNDTKTNIPSTGMTRFEAKGKRVPKGKRNSIDESIQQFLGVIQQSFVKQLLPPPQSRMSLDSGKHKQGYRIKGNSHESVIYYSLYKSIDIFFCLDLYIVTRSNTCKNYSETLSKVNSQRLYKKQLQDLGNSLIYKKIAQWIRENEEEYLVQRDYRDRIEDHQSKMELEEGMNIFNKCLQLLDASNTKRFSFDLEKSIKDFAEKDKANRTSTLTV